MFSQEADWFCSVLFSVSELTRSVTVVVDSRSVMLDPGLQPRPSRRELLITHLPYHFLHVDFTFKCCVCLELNATSDYCQHSEGVFLMGQFQFSIPGITPSHHFKFFTCFKLILFLSLLLLLLLFWPFPILFVCRHFVLHCPYFCSSFQRMLQKEPAGGTTASFHHFIVIIFPTACLQSVLLHIWLFMEITESCAANLIHIIVA